MKKHFFFSILVAMFALGPALGDGVKAESQSKPIGEVTVLFSNLWNEAVDPIMSMQGGSLGLSLVYDFLVGVEPDKIEFSKKTGLARDWKMSPDGKAWTFYLREGVQFHRGFGELTAEDVKFSLERVTSERSVAAQKGYFERNIGEIEVLDRYTVKVNAAEGATIPHLLVHLSPVFGGTEPLIVSKRAVEELGADQFAVNPVGSGPCEFVERVGGQYMKFKAVQNHWRIGTPRFEYVYIRAVPEEETGLAMMARGDADLMGISLANIERVEARGMGVARKARANGIVILIPGQHIKGEPIHNEKVRKALNLAIDRQLIVDTICQGDKYPDIGGPMGNFYTSSVILEDMEYNWREDLYPYDPEKARKLLAEAGYPDGFDMDMYLHPFVGVPEGIDVMQAVAAMWSEIGVRPRLLSADYGHVRSKAIKQEIPGSAYYWPVRISIWPRLIAMYSLSVHSEGVFSFMQSDEADRLIEEASDAVDPEVGLAKTKELIKYVREHHHSFPINEYDEVLAHTEKLEHWQPGPIAARYYWDSILSQ